MIDHAVITSKTRFACGTPSKMRLVSLDSSKTRFATSDSQENGGDENRAMGLQPLRQDRTSFSDIEIRPFSHR